METLNLALSIVLTVLVLVLLAFVLILWKRTEKPVSSFSGEEKAALESLKQEIGQKIEILKVETNAFTDKKIGELVSGEKIEMQKNFAEMAAKNAQSLDAFKSNLQKDIDTFKSNLNSNLDTYRANLDSNLSLRLDGLNSALKKQSESNAESLSSFQTNVLNSLSNQIGEINKRIDSQLNSINDRVNSSLSDGFKNARESLSSVQKELGALSEARRKMDSLTGQISSLSDVLTNSQQRGKYGEFQLETLLEYIFGANMKGKTYDLQYVLRKKNGEDSGLRPDAVVFLGSSERQKILCIDSKFSLVGYEDLFEPGKSLSEEEEKNAKSAFKSALKTRIDESAKYAGADNAMPSSVMFVPNDGVFAYAESEFPDLVKEAYDRHVVLTCPSILEPLLAAYRMVQINDERLKQLDAINQSLDSLGKEFGRLYTRWDKLSAQIDSLTNKKEEVGKTVQKLQKQFSRIQEGKPEIGGEADSSEEKDSSENPDASSDKEK